MIIGDKSDYWKERSERRILNAEKTADEMLRDIKKLYVETNDRITKEIEAFYGRYATETGLSIADVKKLLTDEELNKFRREALKYYEDLSKHVYDPAYREQLKNKIYISTTKEGRKLYSLRRNVSRLDYIQVQMRYAIENMYMQQNEKFTQNLSKTYEDTYMKSVFDTQQSSGLFVPFNSLNKPLVEKAVQQKWLGENYSDRIWADKDKLINTLEQTFTQDIALGKNPRAMASDIKKLTGVKYSNCERLARTEFNHIANEASHEAYKETGVEKYKYSATLDSLTSEICRELDGKVFLESEAEVGVNRAPMHPNCYLEGTEVFTNKGWKKLENCKIFDMCLSWNLRKNKYEFVPVIKTISREVNENLLQFYYKNKLDIIVTKDHKMVMGTKIGYNEAKGLISADLILKLFDIISDYNYGYHFYLGNGEKIKVRDMEIKSIPYKGFVYCVELLKNHTLLVRYNNCVCWCGNCRSTDIPYFDDVDYSKMERLATDPKTGKAYYIPADMNYTDWKNSLTEEQGKYYVANRKMNAQYKQDVKQANEYRKLVTKAKKAGHADLFEGYNFDVKSFQRLKYLQPEKYEIIKNNAKIARGL